MIKLENYSIQEYPKQHKIVITLPQTMTTATTTCSPIGVRKEQLESEELIKILAYIISFYEEYKYTN